MCSPIAAGGKSKSYKPRVNPVHRPSHRALRRPCSPAALASEEESCSLEFQVLEGLELLVDRGSVSDRWLGHQLQIEIHVVQLCFRLPQSVQLLPVLDPAAFESMSRIAAFFHAP